MQATSTPRSDPKDNHPINRQQLEVIEENSARLSYTMEKILEDSDLLISNDPNEEVGLG